MKSDMHYYGTWAMARAAGLSAEAATTIATSAQFVDDNAQQDRVLFRDGGRVNVAATAHHPFDLENIDDEDQRRIWVPFHFLPGDEGEGFTERLVCRKDSPIARELLLHHLRLSDLPCYLQLLGVAAHVYADTFSHYGFSGVSSRRNKVVNDSFEFHELLPDIEEYILEKARTFQQRFGQEGGLMANIKSWFIEALSGALGHGAVVTYPDRPYLIWRVTFEGDEHPSQRDNPRTYLEACQALHRFFVDVAEQAPEHRADEGLDFDAIRPIVRAILLTQAPKQGRIERWQQAALECELFASGPEAIPAYDPTAWNRMFEALAEGEDSRVALSSPVYRFYQAASLHRTYVLRELLPGHGLVVA
jgi:hypothetical protein